jgi:CRP-like cAMP-binding protein
VNELFDSRTLLTEASNGRPLEVYRDRQIVFTQGDPADSVLFIVKGRAKLTVNSSQGKEAVIAVLSADDFLGEGCLSAQPYRFGLRLLASVRFFWVTNNSAVAGCPYCPGFSNVTAGGQLSRFRSH